MKDPSASGLNVEAHVCFGSMLSKKASIQLPSPDGVFGTHRHAVLPASVIFDLRANSFVSGLRSKDTNSINPSDSNSFNNLQSSPHAALYARWTEYSPLLAAAASITR